MTEPEPEPTDWRTQILRAEAASRRTARYADTARRLIVSERLKFERLVARAEAAAKRAEAAAAKQVPIVVGGAVPRKGSRMFNEARQNAYLAHLFDGKWPSQAAKLAGVSMTEVARVRKISPDFAEKEKLADAQRAERAAQALIDMAPNDPRAAIWVAEKFDPDRYGKRDKLEVNVSGQIEHRHHELDPAAQIAEIMALAAQRAELRGLGAGQSDDIIEGYVVEPDGPPPPPTH